MGENYEPLEKVTVAWASLIGEMVSIRPQKEKKASTWALVVAELRPETAWGTDRASVDECVLWGETNAHL